MDSETLIYLLKGGHLNMEDRLKKGIWPHSPLLLKDLIKEVVRVLKSEKSFPHPWIQRSNGEMIDDSIVIEMMGENKYIYRARAASPSNLKVITSQTEKEFTSAEAVVEYYLRWRFPGDLDGWKVVEK